jgi:hypothetical protein
VRSGTGADFGIAAACSELKVGFVDSRTLKFLVGYAFQ